MTLAWLLLAVLSLMWGTSFALLEVALVAYSPVQIMTLRLVIGAGVLLTAALIFKRFRGLPAAWWQYGGVALSGNIIPFTLIGWGQQSISSSVAGAVMGTMPLITAALATLAGVERLSLKRWAGLGLGLVGLWILVINQSALEGSLLGALAVVAAVVGYAISTLIARVGPDKDSLRSGAWTLGTSAGLSSIYLTVTGGWPSTNLDWPFGSLMVLGLFPTGLAAVLYYKVIQLRGPVFLSQVNYFVPVVAFFVGVLIMQEPIVWALPAALGLILAGLTLARQRVE